MGSSFNTLRLEKKDDAWRVVRDADLPRGGIAEPAGADGPPRGTSIRGRVVYPDSSAASRATVVATPVCEGMPIRPLETALTATDGTFLVRMLSTPCDTIRLTAEKRDDFSLRTGEDPLYPRQNGTTPEVRLLADAVPEPVTIRLDLRGASS
jgi:hypothetical protein